MTYIFLTKVIFGCKICKEKMAANFPKFTNLNKHLRLHKEFINWNKVYSSRRNPSESIISKDVFNLVKFVCSSNIALLQLKNPHFIALLLPVLEIPSYKTVRTRMLPEVYHELLSHIGRKLEAAKHISLIADILTNIQMSDYMGLAASLTYNLKQRETIVIGFKRMVNGDTSGHTAENIKLTIESIINEFDFNKEKICCKLSSLD